LGAPAFFISRIDSSTSWVAADRSPDLPASIARFNLPLMRCWAAESNLVVRRGDRRAASTRGYHVELITEQPIPLLAVGWGRHFGAGRLVAVEEG
jgi:hypothetical protein